MTRKGHIHMTSSPLKIISHSITSSLTNNHSKLLSTSRPSYGKRSRYLDSTLKTTATIATIGNPMNAALWNYKPPAKRKPSNLPSPHSPQSPQSYPYTHYTTNNFPRALLRTTHPPPSSTTINIYTAPQTYLHPSFTNHLTPQLQTLQNCQILQILLPQ